MTTLSSVTREHSDARETISRQEDKIRSLAEAEANRLAGGAADGDETPLTRAAQALAILHGKDEPARRGYLRSRGWIASEIGWTNAGMGITDAHFGHAVDLQVKKDAEPFAFMVEKLRNRPTVQ